jgi:hypothetical protein
MASLGVRHVELRALVNNHAVVARPALLTHCHDPGNGDAPAKWSGPHPLPPRDAPDPPTSTRIRASVVSTHLSKPSSPMSTDDMNIGTSGSVASRRRDSRNRHRLAVEIHRIVKVKSDELAARLGEFYSASRRSNADPSQPSTGLDTGCPDRVPAMCRRRLKTGSGSGPLWLIEVGPFAVLAVHCVGVSVRTVSPAANQSGRLSR